MLKIRVGDTINVVIDAIGSDGSGIARNHEGFVFFIPFSLPGEHVEARVTVVKKHYGIANVVSISGESKCRVSPPCPWFRRCGGCQLQHCAYDYQLKLKRQTVIEAFKRIAHLPSVPEISTCTPSPYVWGYRNKASFPVHRVACGNVTGFFAKGSHRIIPINGCMINNSTIDKAFSEISRSLSSIGLDGYSEKSHSGMIRHILLRKGVRTSELLGSFVLLKEPSREQLKSLKNFAVRIKGSLPELVGMTCNINGKKGNTILGKESILLEGRNWLNEKICGLLFRYDSTAFFQVNIEQAEALFNYVCNEATSDSQCSILELYSGVGVMTSIMAKKVESLTAVEEWIPSIESMKRNLVLNNISNVRIIPGKVEEITKKLMSRSYDIVVLDPPRSGCDKQVLSFLKPVRPRKIIYVSCNPATLARDVSILLSDGEYLIEKIRPFDMFPQTSHVETVATIVRV